MDIGKVIVDYWWLFLLALVLDVIMNKNLLRFVVSIIGSVVIFGVVWAFFLSPAISKSNVCFENETVIAKSRLLEAEDIYSEQERADFLCNESTTSFTRLKNCLDLSKKNNGVGFFIYSKLPQFGKAIKDTVTAHDSTCKSQPLDTSSF